MPQVIVPKTNLDPVMSLCPWSIEVNLDQGCRFEVPALPAVHWLRYLLSKQPDFNGLIVDVMPELEDYIFENELPINLLYETALDVISVVSARSWWIALRLMFTAADNWNIVGPKLMFAHIDPTVLSLAAWLDAVLFIMIDNMDPKNVTMFTLKLETPPARNIFTDEVIEIEQPALDREAFLAFAD